jgi:predicted nucleotidyltransferase/biotin operon repressor
MSKNVINQQKMSIMGLFTKNINESLHGREIARRLKANQKTINNNLNILEKEGVLSSKKKGRNIEYSINKNNLTARQQLVMAEHYKLIKAASDNFMIQTIASEIATTGIALIYGSYAKGTAEKDSDIDILFVGAPKKNKLEEIKNRLPIEIHSIITDKSSFIKSMMKKENFIREVMANHILIRGFEEFTEMRFEYGSD